MPEVKIIRKYLDDPEQYKIDTYIQHGGYESLKKALAEIKRDDLIEMVKASGLRGRGGAGAPTGMKWGFMPKEPTPRDVKTLNENSQEMLVDLRLAGVDRTFVLRMTKRGNSRLLILVGGTRSQRFAGMNQASGAVID